MEERISLLIVEDEPLIAADLAATLDTLDYAVTGIAHDYEEAAGLLARKLPDAVLLDIGLGSRDDGIALGELIRQQYRLPFVYLTSYADRATLDRAKKTEPAGYLVKPFDEKSLFATLEVALYTFALRQPLRSALSLEAVNRRAPSALTQREFELLLDLFDGKTNQQMAETRFVSLNTVKTHVKHIFEKLGVHSRPEILVLLREWLG